MKPKTSFKLFEFFFIFFTTSLFTLGGGYAMVPVFQKRFSKYIEEEEFIKILSVAQSMPGPIAVNIAIMLGEFIYGFWGALLAVLGVIIPPIGAIVLFGSFVNKYSDNVYLSGFFKGVYGAIIGLIFGVFYAIVKRQKWKLLKSIILIISVIVAIFFKNFIVFIFLILVIWCYNTKRNC
ncbi:chromate transporter [Thermosipho atlanticus DSM 15807]|uniref:Chromate transporter n=2 Tax=Thermosipho TaxID=2420 RepID=A0A1M5SGZ6_9BACT|nr:chromate transporter [Thermosipho atlanticus DSM 15807]